MQSSQLVHRTDIKNTLAALTLATVAMNEIAANDGKSGWMSS